MVEHSQRGINGLISRISNCTIGTDRDLNGILPDRDRGNY